MRGSAYLALFLAKLAGPVAREFFGEDDVARILETLTEILDRKTNIEAGLAVLEAEIDRMVDEKRGPTADELSALKADILSASDRIQNG